MLNIFFIFVFFFFTSHVRRTVDGIRTFSHSIPRKIYTKAPPAAEVDDESIADEASEPRQERSRSDPAITYTSAERKFFKLLMAAKALKSQQHQ